MSNGPLVERVSALVLEYAQAPEASAPLSPELSLRADLGVESLSLVSLAVRLGDELGADITDHGVELGTLRTVGDLIALATALERRALATDRGG